VYSDICRDLNALRSKCSLFFHFATRNFISISYHEHQEHNSWILAANFKVAFYVDNSMANVMGIGDCQMTNAGAEGALLSVQWAYWSSKQVHSPCWGSGFTICSCTWTSRSIVSHCVNNLQLHWYFFSIHQSCPSLMP
jgi:hypothetical protein